MLLTIDDPKHALNTDPTEELAIGIDLGTTNSLIAIARQGVSHIIGESIKSLVAFYDAHEAVVGKDALDIPHMLQSTKSSMGKTGPQAKQAVEAAALILKTLKEQAEKHLNQPIHRAVITIPAHFDEAARVATKQAAHLAGLDVLRLIHEPTAAALAYGLDQKATGLIAVYDLGGGTFDMSLLNFEKNVFQVIATGGDRHLGGDDMDKSIALLLKKKYLFLNHTESPSHTASHIQRIACTLKEQWCRGKEGEDISMIYEEKPLTLTHEEMIACVDPFIEKTLHIAKSVCNDAAKSFSDITGLVLVGGATKMPYLQNRVQAFFQKNALRTIDPDKVVAMGAALQAEQLIKGTGHLLLDVVPLSLGIEMMGGVVEKIIPRNTPLPAHGSETFTTYETGQTAMKLHVVQGERELSDHCLSLGELVLTGIPPQSAGTAHVKVTFSLDVDGMLSVHAEELSTNAQQAIEIKPHSGLSEDDYKAMILDNMKHGQEDMKKRLYVQTSVKAHQMLAHLNESLEKDKDILSIEEYAAIKNAMQAVETLLNEKSYEHKEALESACHALSTLTVGFSERRLLKALKDV